MGRAYLGERRQVNVRLAPGLIERIDAARGRASRDAWIAEAAELALKPTSQMVVPELRQDIHECEYTRPVRTYYVGDDKIKVRACECGNTNEIKEWRE